MMTVAEAELMKQAAGKGRSASFCVPAQQLCRVRDLDGAQSSQDLNSPENEDPSSGSNGAAAAATAAAASSAQQQGMPSAAGRLLMHDSLHATESCGGANNSSPKARLKAAQQARRSQSCRVPGSRNASRPHVRRRVQDESSAPGSGTSSTANLNHQDSTAAGDGGAVGGGGDGEFDSYNPFLRKVPSCGRLLALAPEDCMYVQDDPDDSPVPLRRSASARRPTVQGGYSDSPVDHSPTPPRHPRQQAKARGTTSSSRKGPAGSRKGGGLLEVRDPNENNDNLDTDQYLLRNFSTTHKGSIINRGDSFRRRRSRSNSIQPPVDLSPQNHQHQQQHHNSSSNAASGGAGGNRCLEAANSFGINVTAAQSDGGSAAQTPDDEDEATGCVHSGSFRVPVVGAPGVGKTALIHQFRTSECINAYDCPAPSDDEEATVSIVLNNYESDIIFVNVTSAEDFQAETQRDVAGWLILYSITDKASFQKASENLAKLQSMSLLRGKAIILAANKCELVRSRAVNMDDGRDLAISYGAKFMEISVGMNHKCDELLVGILHQLRFKEEAEPSERSEKTPWTRNRSLMRASMKAKRLIHRVMGKSDSKYKSCEDFTN